MILSIVLILCMAVVRPVAAETFSMKTIDIEVQFEEGFSHVAREVVSIYPSVNVEIEKKLKWNVDIRPMVILVSDRAAFKKMTGNDTILAFAVSAGNLIVLDTSRVYTKPFTLGTTLKHELCHLILHRNIDNEKLPRWLDEGVCQWTSGGISEMLGVGGREILASAALSDRLFSMDHLGTFPDDEKSLMLAYEQSRSFVEYIVSEFGENSILNILRYLKEGDSINRSFEKSISFSLPEVEVKWHAYLQRKHSWFSYLSNNLYTILFSLAAFVTVYGFVRVLRKKRAYSDGETDENRDGPGVC